MNMNEAISEDSMNAFQPSHVFKNRHVQSILSSAGPRKIFARRRARQLLNDATKHILDCGDGIRLQGEYSEKPGNNKGLVVMIHGWLGSKNSAYVLSASSHLYQQGYNIFRLNLRDHGHSYHLNKEVFDSGDISEVLNAIVQIQQKFPHDKHFLTGFSLGGNFALRVAVLAPQYNINLDRVIAVCPVINPFTTNRNIQDSFIYHGFLYKQWQRILVEKLKHFPDHTYGKKLKQCVTINALIHHLIPTNSNYSNFEEYLSAYAVNGDYLKDLAVPAHIISSKDDPIINVDHLQEISSNANLSIEVTEFGGHCGYIEGLSMRSWVDGRLLQLIRGNTYTAGKDAVNNDSLKSGLEFWGQFT